MQTAPGTALVLLALCLALLPLGACEQQQEAGGDRASVTGKGKAPLGSPVVQGSPYDTFRAAILAGKAGRAEILAALGEADIMGLCNTLLHLYAMRTDPQVRKLLLDLWTSPQSLRDEIGNPLLSGSAARVALAHTLQRAYPAPAYLGFIRGALRDSDPFARAQAVLALGFVGDDQDVPAMRSLALDGDAYVAEVAIKALAIRGSDAAGEALLELQRHYAGEPHMNTVIHQVLLERFPQLSPQQAATGTVRGMPIPDPGER